MSHKEEAPRLLAIVAEVQTVTVPNKTQSRFLSRKRGVNIPFIMNDTNKRIKLMTTGEQGQDGSIVVAVAQPNSDERQQQDEEDDVDVDEEEDYYYYSDDNEDDGKYVYKMEEQKTKPEAICAKCLLPIHDLPSSTVVRTVMPCQHTVCESCLETHVLNYLWQGHAADQIRCPKAFCLEKLATVLRYTKSLQQLNLARFELQNIFQFIMNDPESILAFSCTCRALRECMRTCSWDRILAGTRKPGLPCTWYGKNAKERVLRLLLARRYAARMERCAVENEGEGHASSNFPSLSLEPMQNPADYEFFIRIKCSRLPLYERFEHHSSDNKGNQLRFGLYDTLLTTAGCALIGPYATATSSVANVTVIALSRQNMLDAPRLVLASCTQPRRGHQLETARLVSRPVEPNGRIMVSGVLTVRFTSSIRDGTWTVDFQQFNLDINPYQRPERMDKR